MNVQAFTGGAGCGKTFQLMQSLMAQLAIAPLAEGQKVLALTFMNGSRRRLEERLSQLTTLKGSSECTTVDSFAWRLVRRWRDLARELGYADVQVSQFDRVCDAAAELTQLHEVQSWVAASFPILLLDEAQDLTVSRLKLIQGLATRLRVLAAADEFQCLDEDLRPNPACQWLDQVTTSGELTTPRRTHVAELLEAAASIRGGKPPASGKLFMVQLAPKPPLAGAWVSGNLCWYGVGKSVAIITPVLGTFAKSTLAWTATKKTSKGAGPYPISWEESESKLATAFVQGLALKTTNDIQWITELLNAAGDARVTRDVAEWMDLQRRARAKSAFTKDEVAGAINQVFVQRRRLRRADARGWRAMTVHGAKNREFDNVIVLWPAAISGSDDQKRRLLYNAVTRAKSRCLVLVEATAHLKKAPFA